LHFSLSPSLSPSLSLPPSPYLPPSLLSQLKNSCSAHSAEHWRSFWNCHHEKKKQNNQILFEEYVHEFSLHTFTNIKHLSTIALALFKTKVLICTVKIF
jgi:hypothetical protein